MLGNPKNPVARITDAVCELLAEEGVSALSMRNVASRADATIGLITHHFPNRAAMVKAAANATWFKEQSVVVWPDKPEKTAVLRAVKIFLPTNELRRKQLSVWLAFWALAQTDIELRNIHVDIHRTIREAHSHWIAMLGFSPEQTLAHADKLCVSLDGLLLYSLLDPEHWSPERQISAARQMIDEIFLQQPRSL